MRTLISSFIVLIPTALILAGACADTDSSCEDTLSCPSSSTGGSGGTTSGGVTTTTASGAGGTEATGGTAATTVGGSGGGGTGGTMGEGGAAGEMGTGGSGVSGAGGSPPVCDGELLPGDDACVVEETYGVFVSPQGNDAEGDGSRVAPYATLQKAAEVASESGKRVYACATEGYYGSGLVLSEDHGGLELYGSFECDDWSYDGSLRAKVYPESGVPLTVTGVDAGLEVTGFSFDSADATEPGASSIAALISESTGVVLRQVSLHAGNGADGATGETVAYEYPEKSELDGVSATVEGEGVMPTVTCPAGDTTRGGPGGTTSPGDGSDGQPDHDGDGGEGGKALVGCGNGGAGKDGASAPPGTDGPGASTFGTLTNLNWLPASGEAGDPGKPGQGGGGGSGATTGGGGSGGGGGCGGVGGAAGGGGGASLGLLVLNAGVSLVDSEVTAGDAGDGGAGAMGQDGQQSSGFAGNGFQGGCQGGIGGLGGNGGNGGGGAGGISVGVVVVGTAPVLTNTEVTVGDEGLGGLGAGTDNSGIAGIAELELDLTDA